LHLHRQRQRRVPIHYHLGDTTRTPLIHAIMSNLDYDPSSSAEARLFTFGERLGLVFISQAAALSFIAVVSLLSWLTVRVFFGLRRNQLNVLCKL
jgi:hypothetical protein